VPEPPIPAELRPAVELGSGAPFVPGACPAGSVPEHASAAHALIVIRPNQVVRVIRTILIARAESGLASHHL
jgi:hypothetical protein